MTDDILQLSKIQSGMLRRNKETVMVREFVDDFVCSTKISAQDKTVGFNIDCPETLAVHADRDRLKQIMINIISNAIKYSQDKVEISIIIRQLQSLVEFRIKDNGIGIEPDKLPYIFEKFYRIEKSRDTRYGGTGLGLSIVKRLVELHGGNIFDLYCKYTAYINCVVAQFKVSSPQSLVSRIKLVLRRLA